MKAIVLAGGRGTRLNEISESQNKCVIKLAGKLLIEYSLDYAMSVGIEEIIVVVGYKATDIINACGINYKGKRIRYVLQSEQRGLVHAIECCANAIGDDDFMLSLGDEILVSPKHRAMFEMFQKERVFGICGTVGVEDKKRISRTYAIVHDGDNRIYRLIEKPTKPMNNLMGTGNCLFRNEILAYIEQTPINQQRGEKELPDLIQCAIDEGNVVKSFVICDYYVNVNSEEDLREAAEHLSAR